MNMLKPDYIFESSWEVCNKVGGIYTVLSTRAKTLQDEMKDRIIFIGPDCWKENDCPYFREDKSLFAAWQWEAKEQGLKVRVGRWTVPGEPIAILVDFTPYFEKKDEIYTWLWEKYSVDSLHAYGDYDEASMFSYAAALVTESMYNFNVKGKITRAQLNSGNFGCRINYPTNTNKWNGYLRISYVRVRVEYVLSDYTVKVDAVDGYNNEPFDVTLRVSNKNLTRYNPTLTLTVPIGFTYNSYEGTGKVTRVNNTTYRWEPSVGGSGTSNVTVRFIPSVTYPSDTGVFTGTFTLSESLNGANASKTVSIRLREDETRYYYATLYGNPGYGDHRYYGYPFEVRGLSDGNWITTIAVNIVSDCVLDDGTVTYFLLVDMFPNGPFDTVATGHVTVCHGDGSV